MGEKYWKKIVIRLLLRLYKEHANRKRRNSPIEKWTKSLNWHIEVRKNKANSHENTCKLNIVQKMEIKTDFSPHQISKNHSTDNSSVDEGGEKWSRNWYNIFRGQYGTLYLNYT